MARRNHDDDPILDANDAVRWAVMGTLSAAPSIALLSAGDALGWPLWVRILVGIPVWMLGGAAYQTARCVHVERRRLRTGPTCSSPAPTPVEES